MSRLFGTDGVRGVANVELTANLALNLGRASAAVLAHGSSAPFMIIGRDTRASGHFLEAALAAGMMSAGARVGLGGVLPTPAVAYLVTELGADAGGVISASHNPAADNGIKFFGSDGFKLSDAQEDRIEEILEDVAGDSEVGDSVVLDGLESRYVQHALSALEGRRLDGMRVVVDCANGAAFATTPAALSLAGAEVIPINVSPDGLNINVDCGSTHPEAVARAVLEHRADVGLAHDGDADRVIAVDETGAVVDGDPILATLAIDLKQAGRLQGNVAVVTVMANLGLRRVLDANGVRIVEAPVGDRYVLEAMRNEGAVLGGEQSGHLIFLDYATTGDGLVTALRLLGRMISTGKKLSDLSSVVEKYPQVLLNVKVDRKSDLAASETIGKMILQSQEKLEGRGRVVVRPSGTEPVVRVMVEAEDERTAEKTAHDIAEVVTRELGGR